MLDLVAPGNEYANLGVLSILRLARVLRLLKLLRKVKSLRELQKLVKMMHTCIKALFWSFIFCFVVMTIWAMLIVEWIDPYVRDMVEEGLFEECGVFCETATTSVMKANLLLFKTVIAGDSWGQMAVPVILMHPETAVIFMGSSLTVVFGVLNLIVAVVDPCLHIRQPSSRSLVSRAPVAAASWHRARISRCLTTLRAHYYLAYLANLAETVRWTLSRMLGRGTS